MFLKASKTKTKKSTIIIPKSVQQSIPYLGCYEQGGIIETKQGTFTKSYLLRDVNFHIASQQEQEEIYEAFTDILNSFSSNVTFEITMNTKNVDKQDFIQNVLLSERGDEYDEYREEYNQMLLSQMSLGRNNLLRETYLTVSLQADSVENAITSFAQLDSQIKTGFNRISKSDIEPMSLEERLEILHDIYNLGQEGDFSRKITITDKKGKEHIYKSFDLKALSKMGITTKDIIGPMQLKFNNDHFQIDNNVYGQVLFLKGYPAFSNTDFLTSISDISCNMLLSLHYDPVPPEKGVKMLRNQMVNINANVIEAQKKATKAGYSTSLISPDLIDAQNQASDMMQDVVGRNQKLFRLSIVITHFAPDMETLLKNQKTILSVGEQYLCRFRVMTGLQEQGFNTSLPLAQNQVEIKRTLTSETAALFMPFSSIELRHRNGRYYGLNTVSKNMIFYNRTAGANANGMILGVPGSGKSFAAKREIAGIFLGTDDDIFVIDPEAEYVELAKAFGGEVIQVSPSSPTHINLLDMDLQYADDDDPVTMKSNYIQSVFETILMGGSMLTPLQRTVIDRCVKLIYQPYLGFLQRSHKTVEREQMPTLKDFYNLLCSQKEVEANFLALALEMYVSGTQNMFSYKTNVNTKARFTVYDTKKIGTSMKALGLQICLNDIWNRTIENKRKNKRTWFFIDEMHLLTQTESSAKFLQEIYKRARKWMGVPTGMTQNVDDMLQSKEACVVLQNCEFVMMLKQAPLDRAKLAKMFNISQTQQGYIRNSESGQGLIYTGTTIVPFTDHFPENTRLYQVMTTKPEDIIE